MQVNLYIYTESEFIENVPLTCDDTLITSDSTLYTSDQTQMSSSSLVNSAKKIDLFPDEKISITSSIQNINDISRVFTDYSQSFTIPASKKNNETFRHWYENAIENGFNQFQRYDGFIEIDNALFRTGRWQIESGSIKDGRIHDYKLTFYGNLKSLKDKFGEDKLSNVTTINQLNFNYSVANVFDTIENPSTSGVMFPLISSQRLWQSGGGGVNDITDGLNGIQANELFPAVKISSLFYAIGEKYGVSFNGNFLTQNRFNESYLWLKNKETFLQRSSVIDTLVAYPFDTIGSLLGYELAVDVNVPSGVTWFLKVYKNGVFLSEGTSTGTGTFFVFSQSSNVYDSLNAGTYTFTIQTDIASTFTLDFNTIMTDEAGGYVYQIVDTFTTDPYTTTSYLDLASLMPDIKVSDFFSGVLKMFNLTAFSKTDTIYTIEQLEQWYESGEIKDFSGYTFTDVEVERIKAYKNINFKYQKCESLVNRNFYNVFSREYGDLISSFTNDGGDYNIDLPFENLQFANLNSNLNVGYALQSAPDYKPYIPKPIILYKYGNVSGNFNLVNGASFDPITTYNAFGQDIVYNGALNSLNFGVEYSLYSNNAVNNSLFNNYYFSYLNNLYSLKSRMVKVSMRLPFTQLINLKLNDRIVIRDKRYIINQYTTDLDTFETKFELVQDFRSILPNNNLGFTYSNEEQTIEIDFIPYDGLTWGVRSDPFNQIQSFSYDSEKITIVLNENLEGVAIVCELLSNNDDKIYITQNG